MDPLLFFRDSDSDVLFFLPNTVANINRLRMLATDGHKFEVAHGHSTLMVGQGQTPRRVPSSFLTGIEPERGTLLVAGGDVREVCALCRHDRECLGPTRRSSPLTGAMAQDAAGVLSNLIVEAEIDDCPLFELGNVSLGTIEKRHLVALGFEPLTSARAFTDDNVDDADYAAVAKLNGFENLDQARELVGRHWIDDVISDGWRRRRNARGWGEDMVSSRFNDLFFTPDLVHANRVKARIRGLNSGASRRRFNAYRREHCQSCVYPCEHPPWGMNSPNPLTNERVLDTFMPDDDERQWMAMFLATGRRGVYVSDETGRPRNGIGRRPKRLESGDWGIEVMGLVPAYTHIAYMPLADYWRESDHHGRPDEEFLSKYDKQLPVLRPQLSDEQLAYLNMALKFWDQTDERRFYVYDHPSRNDILSVELMPMCDHIRVGSDTMASGGGGRFSYSSGSSICAADRPRFHTEYSHPYVESIWNWLYIAPWACSGRPK
jgi:hypothetical protein